MDLRVSPPGGLPAVTPTSTDTHTPTRPCAHVHAHVSPATHLPQQRQRRGLCTPTCCWLFVAASIGGPRACARCVACAWVHGCACHSHCAWHRRGIKRVQDRRSNATIRFHTWRRGHAEMQSFQAQHDTAHCSGSDADLGSGASAGARTSSRVSTLAVHSPHGEDLLRGEDRKPQL